MTIPASLFLLFIAGRERDEALLDFFQGDARVSMSPRVGLDPWTCAALKLLAP
jgi:hypothetical protein